MVFKDTSSTNSSVRLKRQRGATLVEVMVAILISSIVAMVVMTSVIYSARSYASLVNYIDLDQKSRNALDTIILDVRESIGVVSCTTNHLAIRLLDGTDVEFFYDSGDRTLTRVQGSSQKILLTECDGLEFGMFQRNPIEGQMAEFIPTSNRALCKIVQVNWICSRQILGRTWNTESVQTAKIVMRNQRKPRS